jgi:hypothetical protein
VHVPHQLRVGGLPVPGVDDPGVRGGVGQGEGSMEDGDRERQWPAVARDRVLSQLMISPGAAPGHDGAPCWEWAGSRFRNGYGRLLHRNVYRYASRAAWELLRGPVPAGYQVRHLCGNPGCCNPAHLMPWPWRTPEYESAEDRALRLHPACPQGHPYEGRNVIIRGDGGVRCRTCKNNADRERMRAIRAAR